MIAEFPFGLEYNYRVQGGRKTRRYSQNAAQVAFFLRKRKERRFMCEEISTLSEEEIFENLNLLNESYNAFLKLVNLSYKIKLAKNNKVVDLELIFLEVNFVHLAGLDKLTDITFVTEANPNVLYKEFKKNNNESRKALAASTYFKDIVGRLYSIIDLRDNFDNAKDNKHYKFIQNIKPFYTQIKYEYQIKSEYEGDTYYYFLRNRNNPKNPHEYVIVSTFIENELDYATGQSFVTLLKKVEVDKTNGLERLIYKSDICLDKE